ncbi:hypothetical protein ACF1BS_03070 [Streptomyces sp. NPDC014748]|uniref:hypothetical protein n=1 Tax=Streptomyces sp. NPDC014748 TaxID=3364905 RepID=UPI0036FFCDCF
MNTTAAALEAHVAPATVRSWCRRGVVAATKQAGRWIIDQASLTHRITIGAMRTRKGTTMTEPAVQYPWDDDHDNADEFLTLVKAGITPEQIVAALGRDACGMGRYRPLNGRSRRWLDSMLTDVQLAAEARQTTPRRQAREELATDRQIDYILDLLARRHRSGEGGGFFTGPTDRAGIAKLSRSEASAYISSLKGDY